MAHVKSGKIVYQGKTKKGREIIVRYPTSKDLLSILNYFNTLSKEQTFIRFQGEQLTLKEEKKYLADMFEKIKKGKAIILMVFTKEKLIGFSDIKLQEKIESHIGIFGITVAKEFRNEGIGKLLINLVFQEAKKYMPNLKIVTLGVFSTNPVAKEIYEKFGFTVYGTLPNGIFHKSRFIDHIYMCKNV